jgi:hypothetical protein
VREESHAMPRYQSTDPSLLFQTVPRLNACCGPFSRLPEEMKTDAEEILWCHERIRQGSKGDADPRLAITEEALGIYAAYTTAFSKREALAPLQPALTVIRLAFLEGYRPSYLRGPE